MEEKAEIREISAPYIEDSKGPSVSAAPELSLENIPKNLLAGNDAVNALRPDSDFVRYSWDRLNDIISEYILSIWISIVHVSNTRNRDKSAWSFGQSAIRFAQISRLESRSY